MIKIISNYEKNKDYVDERLNEELAKILFKKLQGNEKELERLKEIFEDDSINITL